VNTRSLGFRLVTWYASVLTLVFVILGLVTLIYLRHSLESNVLDTQARRARQIADTLLAELGHTGESALSRQVEDLYSPARNERFIRITRGDGQVLYASGKPMDSTFDPTTVPPLRLTSTVERFRKEAVPGGAFLIATLEYPPIDKVTAKHSPTYFVEVGVSNDRTETTLRQVAVMLALGLPITVFIAVGGGFLLVGRALKPVERMARTASDITQHNLSLRLPVVHTGDELERLSISLNHMIARLEEAIRGSKRFVADASHELRTPLSILRGELEGLAQDEGLDSQRREQLGGMLEEVDCLADIVQALLALSRLDAGEGRAELVPLDLAELAATTAEQMTLLAEDKDITIVREGVEQAIVEGDRARLKQVVVNLLDNAIKYAPPGGTVWLRVGDTGAGVMLEIEDQGIGIPAEALPHVFERFYRVDDSRSRAQGGVGLGLSIVKSICDAHSVHVDVSSGPGKGTRFSLRFPPPLPAHPATRYLAAGQNINANCDVTTRSSGRLPVASPPVK
jgi:heavy metal sensor kinase